VLKRPAQARLAWHTELSAVVRAGVCVVQCAAVVMAPSVMHCPGAVTCVVAASCTVS
jgi:hypothetical protein